MGVELQTVIEVSDCGESECVLEMGISTEDGMWYTFSIPDELANNEIQWYIDGQPIEGAYGTSFEADLIYNPNWSVCVDVYTEACPDGMEACYSNLEGNCPDAHFCGLRRVPLCVQHRKRVTGGSAMVHRRRIRRMVRRHV